MKEYIAVHQHNDESEKFGPAKAKRARTRTVTADKEDSTGGPSHRRSSRLAC